MADRKYYCFCDSNCKFETMTKEQILAAIAEATGNAVSGVDEAFITHIKETNANIDLKFWRGTMSQFNALATKDANTYYIITDDDTLDIIEEGLEQLQEDMNFYYGATAKKFTAPTLLNDDKKLQGAGYYMFFTSVGGTNTCHGVVYWDGKSVTHARGGVNPIDSYRLRILSDGTVQVYSIEYKEEDSTEHESTSDLYVAKLGE